MSGSFDRSGRVLVIGKRSGWSMTVLVMFKRMAVLRHLPGFLSSALAVSET